MTESEDWSDELPAELEEDIKSHIFAPEELQILCEMPCEVRMSECNRLWSYEQMMIGQFKQKGEVIRDKHIQYIHQKFFKKFDYHYKKQLELEERHKKVRDFWHLYFNYSGALFLEEKRTLNQVYSEPLEQSSSSENSFNIDYSLTEEISNDTIETLSSVGGAKKSIEAPPPANKNVDSEDDLNDFVHNLAPGVEIESEPMVEVRAIVSSQLADTQSSSYTQFQKGVTVKSTQEIQN